MSSELPVSSWLCRVSSSSTAWSTDVPCGIPAWAHVSKQVTGESISHLPINSPQQFHLSATEVLQRRSLACHLRRSGQGLTLLQ